MHKVGSSVTVNCEVSNVPLFRGVIVARKLRQGRVKQIPEYWVKPFPFNSKQKPVKASEGTISGVMRTV